MNSEQKEKLLMILQARFQKNMHRHQVLTWTTIEEKLMASQDGMWAIQKMEESGGEPDVVVWEGMNGEICFADCSVESPTGRRNVCYDAAALNTRKTFKPDNSACEMARKMGTELLSEQQYHLLQTLGVFDLKTSSWVKTPDEIRAKGGALFGDRRFGRVFIYHNGAQSYYAVRGFRAIVKL